MAEPNPSRLASQSEVRGALGFIGSKSGNRLHLKKEFRLSRENRP
jgi:hypothetical protein